MSAEKPRRLGRGLEALLAVTQPQQQPSGGTATEGTGQQAAQDPSSQVQRVPIASIRANPYQPRKEFRDEELADLESSLRATGLLQPITLRPGGRAGGYELIAGERRLRAATRLGWTEIPAIVREVDDRTLLTFAIVENLQRVDLNPLEEAEGFKRLIDEFGLTQQQVADVVGKDRTTVTNLLRVLSLPDPVKVMLRDGAISLGHARALLALSDPRQMQELANVAVAEALSVREVERRVRATNEPSSTLQGATTGQAPSAAPAQPLNPHLKLIEDRLRRKLQTDVSLHVSGGDKGSIRIGFYSTDDLDRLLDVMLGADRTDFD